MNRWFLIALADAIAAGNSGGSHGAMQENAHLAQPAIQASQSKIKARAAGAACTKRILLDTLAAP